MTTKLEKLCSGQYPAEERGVTVTTYRIIDEALAWEIDDIADNGKHRELEEFVLGLLNLHDESGYIIAPGASWTAYAVTRIDFELLAVVETVLLNV